MQERAFIISKAYSRFIHKKTDYLHFFTIFFAIRIIGLSIKWEIISHDY